MAFNEALTISGEKTVCERGRCHLQEPDDWCACLENVDFEYFDMQHMALYCLHLGAHTRTHTHTHNVSVIDTNEHSKV